MEHLQRTGKLKETLEMCLIRQLHLLYPKENFQLLFFLWIKENQLINQIQTLPQLCLFPQMIQIQKYCSADEEEGKKNKKTACVYVLFLFVYILGINIRWLCFFNRLRYCCYFSLFCLNTLICGWIRFSFGSVYEHDMIKASRVSVSRIAHLRQFQKFGCVALPQKAQKAHSFWKGPCWFPSRIRFGWIISC